MSSIRRVTLLPIRSRLLCILFSFQLLICLPPHPSSEWHGTSSYPQVVVYAQEVEDEEITEGGQQQRILQNKFCTHQPSLSTTSSSDKVITQVLTYLDSHKSSIQNTILQSYTDHFENATQPSTQYLYDDFRDSLEWMARVGVDRPSGGGTWKFYLGPDNCDNDGWHIGLANVAAFLGQSMTMVILNDTCDELNWEQIFPNPYDEIPRGYYPLSNACGQRGVSYTSSSMHTCPPGEEQYQCTVNPTMKITAASKSTFGGSTPPPLKCFPRTADQTYTGHYDPRPARGRPRVINEEGNVVPSKAGLTDVEGCCFWGRGALHTGGVCNLGKLNYFLGEGGGQTTRYPDINFCTNPEAICADETRTMEMRWAVALFEWVERVQSYDNNMGWNYLERVTTFMDGDVISRVQFSSSRGEPSHFIDQVGGILEQGCPFPPCDLTNPNRLRWKSQRKKNFITAMQGVGLPVQSELFRSIEEHFTNLVNFEEVLLLSKSPVDGKTHQSYRYHFNDFLESLGKMHDIGFEDNFFYLGQGPQDVTGLLNIAMFLAYAIEMSILDDACDEHNTQLVNGRYPVSNSCGQYGASYQEMVCGEGDTGKECPLNTKQSLSAVTRPSSDRAPQPFKCAPKSQYPVTGFWDEDRLEENHNTAFSNQIGRIDVEGCCWWGRGILRHVTHGRCIFGQMNYYIGKRAAKEGRPSLYPDIDFCENPEAICSNESSNEVRWVSGMFYWIKRLQSFDKDGWSYMDKLNELSRSLAMSGELDREILKSVDCILKTNSIDCDSAEDMSDRLNEVLTLITTVKLPTLSPTATTSPSASPTDFPTISPTDTPTLSPTHSLEPSSSPNIFWLPSRQDVDSIIKTLQGQQDLIKSEVLMPRVDVDDVDLYSFEKFLAALNVFADGTVEGMYFYVGHESRNNRKRGLVNIAAFLAHSKTVAVYNSVCDEHNMDSIKEIYPLSNSCGQYGKSYQNIRCAPEESFMECPPDPGLQMTAVAQLTGSSDGAVADQISPPPFFCGPRRYFPFMGYYDGETNTVRNDEPFANRAGRTDVEGCCFWGRGALQVKGVCMYGKLNYYLGARAKMEGRRSLFPNVDFCQNPQAICSGQYSYSLMWITGIFAWIELVQSLPEYSDNLLKIVDGDMNEEEFIDAVSDIVGSNDDDKIVRQSNFKSAIEALGLRL